MPRVKSWHLDSSSTFVHLSGVNPELDVFRLKLSCYSKSTLLSYTAGGINKRNLIKEFHQNTTTDIILQTLKLINSNFRDYDPEERIWYFKRSMWSTVEQSLLSLMASKALYLQVEQHTSDEFDVIFDLNVASKPISSLDDINAPKPEEFFKSTSIASSSVLSKDALEAQLLALTGFEFNSLESAKKVYRKAALMFHPDRNPNDSSLAQKMTELNSLWMEYQKYV